jgi:hypothetical protein
MLTIWRRLLGRRRIDKADDLECWIAVVPVGRTRKPTASFIGPTANAVQGQIGRVFAEAGEDERAGWAKAQAHGWRVAKAALILEGQHGGR